MRLSVILPCFNSAETIAVQLEALTQQQWSSRWEVIVANNGSTDESMAIVERYRDRLPHLKIVQAYSHPSPRLGVPHSYNVGIKAARGDAFVFCEGDDEVAPGWLIGMGKALTQHDFVACRLEYHKLNEPWRMEDFGEGLQVTGLFEPGFPPYLPWASGCGFGFRRSLYEAIGELNTAFPASHDTEYCWRAQLAGFQLHFVPEAVVHYRFRHTHKAIYRQAYNWGKDFVRLRKYYRSPFGRLDFGRWLATMAVSLPQGLWLLLQRRLNKPSSRGKFASWLWSFGYQLGSLAGLMRQPPSPHHLPQTPDRASQASNLTRY